MVLGETEWYAEEMGGFTRLGYGDEGKSTKMNILSFRLYFCSF